MEQANNTNTQNETLSSPVNTSEQVIAKAPDPQSPSTPDSPHKSPNPKPLIVTTIICAILAIAGVAFGIYGMFLKPEPKNTTYDDQAATSESIDQPQTPVEGQEAYQLSDYVSFSEKSIPVTFPDEVEKGHTEDIIKIIELRNIPASVISDFNNAQEQKITTEDAYNISQTNEVGASINGSLLSAYTIYKYHGVYGDSGSAETINYDIDNQQKISNQELAKLYNITAEEVYDKVLRHLVQNVTTTSFLLNTRGDTRGPSISIEEFTNQIPQYKSKMPADLTLLKMYIDENNTVHVLYKENEILESLGMGTNMGAGLLPGIQDVEIK